MNVRCNKGATLGLSAGLIVLLVLIGCSFYYLARIIGGARQTANATDAGANGAARAILSVAVPAKRMTAFPEFEGLGTNIPANGAAGAPNPKFAPGEPDAVAGSYNIFAYNRAAGAATLIALNALEEAQAGSPNAVDNANTVIDNLATFGDTLNKEILNSGKLGQSTANAFKNIANNNNVKMLGSSTSTNLASALQFKAVTTESGGGGKSNVYFDLASFNNDPFYTQPNAAPATEDTTGSITSVALPDSLALPYEKQPVFQESQPLLKGYQAINLGGGTKDIYLCAVNPASTSHLVDQDRFRNSASQIGYAPVNAIQANAKTREQTQAVHFNGSIIDLACAIVGSVYNEYPITLPHGYIRLKNGPDALQANPILATGSSHPTRIFPITDGSVSGEESIFNNELWPGTGGEGGVWLTNNGVFGTNNSGAASIFSAWIAYNTGASSTFPGGIPNPNIRKGTGRNQLATVADMMGITSIDALCTDFNVTVGNVGSSAQCIQSLTTMAANYGDTATGIPTPLPPGTELTNIEAFKGEVIEQWENDELSNFFGNSSAYLHYTYKTDGHEFKNDSGSKYIARKGVAYAVPTSKPSIAIGQVVSPGELLQQLTNDGAICVDPSPKSPMWNDSTTMQGRLLQRCKEILPSADATMVSDLLFKLPINLGAYQYIYLPPNGDALAISSKPPAFLKGLPEYTTPGITKADGVALPQCQDSAFDPVHNIVDAIDGPIPGGGAVNIHGDANLHGGPFYNFKGKTSTYDYAVFTPSSGKDNLLGCFAFYEHLSANGVFSGIN